MVIRVLDTVLVRLAGAAAAEGTDDRGGFEFAGAATDYLVAKVHDTAFMRAVAVASPQLSAVVEQVAAGKSVPAKRIRSAAVSLRRYEIRFRCRTVPFGLFAGVGTAIVGAESTAVGPPRFEAVEARRSGAAGSNPAVLVTNYCAVRRGELWTLDDDVAAAGKRRGDGAIMLRASGTVDAILTLAGSPIRTGDLIAETTHRLGADASEIGSDVRELTALGFLVATGPSNASAAVVPDLKVVAPLRIADAVAAEARHAIEAMARICPPSIRSTALTDYHRRFREQFGVAHAVPILEVVDGAAGIGYPDHYRSAAPSFGPASGPLRDRSELLAELLSARGDHSRSEFELTDNMVEMLAGVTGVQADSPGDIGFHLALPEQTHATARPFTLIRSTTGSPSLGAVAGRFRHLLDERYVRAVTDEVRAMGDRVAGLAFEPFAGNDAAVARTGARVAPLRIAIDRIRGSGEIPIRDVVVYSDGARLCVATADDPRPLRVVREDMRSLVHAAPRIARLLWDLSGFDAALLGEWSWGMLTSTRMSLPRVRYRNTVLRRRQWRLPMALRAVVADRTAWGPGFTEWARAAGLPRYVEVPRGDQGTSVDTASGLDVEVLRQELAQGRDPWIVESILDFDGIDGAGGHITELVFSYTPQPPVSPARPHVELYRSTARERAVSGAWLYFKVYAAVAHQDEVLRRFAAALPGGAQGVGPRWFFVRYRDADGDHLRIRVEPDSGGFGRRTELAVHAVLDSLRAERLCRAVVLAGYVPELHRYGGPQAMPAAESVFHADSVLAVSAAADNRALDRENLLAVAVRTASIAEAILGASWREQLCAALDRDHRREVFRADRHWYIAQFADRRASFTRSGPVIERWRATQERYRRTLLEQRRDRSLLTIARSLMHLHINRTTGIDRGFEDAVDAVLRGWCEAGLNREQFATDRSSRA
ncbi:hypothetical protein D5S18_25830 [Nocardia panacis]|uniref:Lantibiotic dehydratase n=1 Tax=Nocardia panacis TaxID=2340916 RepID=A0A3A4KAM5_9NOCA|nr:lantibiotic dehydratase [Nocardia panacis]RJO70641.1 hypothetical protein D5S18_25830 [Nocardia panacis]